MTWDTKNAPRFYGKKTGKFTIAAERLFRRVAKEPLDGDLRRRCAQVVADLQRRGDVAEADLLAAHRDLSGVISDVTRERNEARTAQATSLERLTVIEMGITPHWRGDGWVLHWISEGLGVDEGGEDSPWDRALTKVKRSEPYNGWAMFDECLDACVAGLKDRGIPLAPRKHWRRTP